MAKLVKIVLALVLVIGVLVLMNLGTGIKTVVETLGPEMTQAQVTLNSAKISLLSGDGRLKGLVIGNPEGFDTENAFSLGEIYFSLDQESLTTDIIVIETLKIVAPEVTMESGRGGSNLDRLQANITQYLGTDDSVASDGQTAKNIIIRDLVITEGQLHYGLLGSKTLDVPLPTIHLAHIGEDGQGVSMAQATAKIVSAISKSATKAALQSGSVEEIGDTLEAQIKDKASGLKALFKK